MKHLRNLKAAWLLSCLALLPVGVGLAALAPSDPIPVGRVVWVDGKFQAALPGKSDRDLSKASLIYAHDTLKTDDKSKAEIVFTDNGLMTFRPSTTFVIEQYEYHSNNEKGSVGKNIMNLVEGGFRTITGLIAKDNPNNYAVNTPVATLSVRGTDFDTAIQKKAGKKVTVFLQRNGGHDSSPCITSSAKGEKGKTMCLDEKTSYAQVIDGDAPTALNSKPMVFSQTLPMVPAVIQPCNANLQIKKMR